MTRKALDTFVYATILVAPMATALAYIALAPASEVVVVASPVAADCPEPLADAVAPTPEPVVEPIVASEPAPDPPASSTAGAGNLVFERQLVLATRPDIAWSKGQLRDLPNEWGVTLTKAASLGLLPPDLAGLADQRFVVYAANGDACTTRTGAISLYARVDGDVMPTGDPLSGDGLTPAELRSLRASIFTDHAELLLARQTPRCTGLWARRADLPAPAVFGRANLDDDARAALTTEIAARLADHPEVASVRAQYATWYADIEPAHRDAYSPWPAFYRDTIDVQRWDEIGGPRSYLTVDVGSDGVPCSDEFAAHVSLVLTRLPGEDWQVRDEPGFWRPQALMDLDRDDHLEAVVRGGTQLETRGPDATLGQSYEIPYWGCPC